MSDYSRHVPPPEVDSELIDIAQTLHAVAERIQPDSAFKADLQSRLISSHSGGKVRLMPSLRKLTPILLWVLALAVMLIVVDWTLRSLAPSPVPAAGSTPSTSEAPAPPVQETAPAPSSRSYDWHGTTLYLSAALPDSSPEAGLFLAQPRQHATVEEARSLAEQFGIQGEVYEMPGELPNTMDYLVTDGKQSMHVRSANYFSYTADMIHAYNNFAAVQDANAETIITAFLENHAFALPHRVEWSGFRSAYEVELLASDGVPLRYEHFSPPMLLVTLDQDGNVASLQASLLDIQGGPAARYPIIGPDEALQRLLDPAQAYGIISGLNSTPAQIQQWNRAYPMDETLTIYGRASSVRSVEQGKPAFLWIDGFPVAGQVSGLDALTERNYVEAVGQVTVEDGIQRFMLESWQPSDALEEGLVGTLTRTGDQVTLSVEDGSILMIPDVPDDISMPFEQAYVIGTRIGDVFQWKMIDNRMASGGGGGGGGGGGSGFYKLNLSGTPVPFPTPTVFSPASVAPGQTEYIVQAGDTLGAIAASSDTTVEDLMRANNMTDPNTLTIGQVLALPQTEIQHVDALRGILNIMINKQPDGSQSTEYGFLATTMNPGSYMLLQGPGLEALQSYNSRPVDVWGTLGTAPDTGRPVINVERYQIPFPDLKVQVLQGTQKLVGVGGQQATLFTASDGTEYIQLFADGTAGASLIGSEGDQVQIEAMAIPGETFGGYPSVRVFGGMLAIDPKTGLHMTLPLTADKPVTVEIPPSAPGSSPSSPPTATIEKTELVYYLSDPRYIVPEPGVSQNLYFQPAWRFYGHYSTGDEFEVLIQALPDEFLLPELEPYVQGG